MAVTKRLPSGGAHGGYGWRPDLPDHRDFLFAADPAAIKKLASTPHLDLSTAKAMPAVWDQGQLGSCTAHSVGAAFAFAHKVAKKRALMPSRLWIYFQERVIEGTVSQDAGAEIRDGFKVIAGLGVPPESEWKYDISTFAGPPPSRAVKGAERHKALAYRAVPQDLTQLKLALLGGFPVSFGFSVYESFESAEVATSGIVMMPGHGESLLGGHAVVIVGFDDPSQRFIVRNSWGDQWGQNGYFTMPYQYVLSASLASDFWQATLAS